MQQVTPSLRIDVRLILSVLLLVSQALFAATVSIVWDAPNDPIVVGYRVYWWSGSTTNTMAVGNSTHASVTNLTQGVQYRMAVTSLDMASIESDYSSQIIYDVPIPSSATNIVIMVEHSASVLGPWLTYPNVVFVGPPASNMQVFRAIIKLTP